MSEILSKVFVFLGSLFFLVSAIGVIKFPDVFTRMHAASKSSSLGLGLILLGVAAHFGTFAVVLKCLLIVLFIFLTTPVAAHILARAGYLSGALKSDRTRIDEVSKNYEELQS